MTNLKDIRHDFPMLEQKIYGKPLVYLDNAATTQKPQMVLDAQMAYYSTTNANARRGISFLSNQASQIQEQARQTVANFIGAEPINVICTKNTTEAINLAAFGWALHHLKSGDQIVVTEMEHHANLIPWQQVAKRKSAELVFIPVVNGVVDLVAYEKLLTKKVKLVCIPHISNVFGSIVPVKKMTELAHRVGAKVLIDGPQAVPHIQVDVTDIACDWYAFSAHKVYGPTGVGFLYASDFVIDEMQPTVFGGSMIEEVQYTSAVWTDAPFKFEAGTQDIAGIHASATALQYLSEIGWETITNHESVLLVHARKGLAKIPGVNLLCPPVDVHAGVISFTLENVHSHDVGQVLDQEGIVVRVGHHCAQPLMSSLGLTGTVRVSFGIYNTLDDVDAMLNALEKVKTVVR